MTIAALITEGIGPGSAIKFVLTGGLDIGEAVVSTVVTGGWGYPKRKPAKPEKPDWLDQREHDELLAAEARAIYERVIEGKLPQPVARAVVKAVAPYADRPVVRKPPPSAAIDFRQMTVASGALDRLLAALAKIEARSAEALAAEARHARAQREALIEADDADVIDQLLQSGIL